jgi:hypothetical protein
MIEGLWTAEFASCANVYSGGVFIFQNGVIMGGDGGYFYFGDYCLNGNEFKAKLILRPFKKNCTSVFKTMNQDLMLDLAGSLKSDSLLIAKGHPREDTNLTCAIKFTKRPLEKLS